MRVFTLLALCCASLSGQSDRGTITGNVTDPSGASVAGARLTLRHVATGEVASVTSNASGEYSRPGLQPGDYVVTVEAQAGSNCA